MSIDFSVDPELAEQLDWVRGFVATEIEPIDLAWPAGDAPYDRTLPVYDEVVRPLQLEVRERGLWAWHLPPELGGQGRGQGSERAGGHHALSPGWFWRRGSPRAVKTS